MRLDQELVDLIVLFVYQATAEANNLTAVAGAKDLYSKSMEQARVFSLRTEAP